jgi:hypothetical protein
MTLELNLSKRLVLTPTEVEEFERDRHHWELRAGRGLTTEEMGWVRDIANLHFEAGIRRESGRVVYMRRSGKSTGNGSRITHTPPFQRPKRSTVSRRKPLQDGVWKLAGTDSYNDTQRRVSLLGVARK